MKRKLSIFDYYEDVFLLGSYTDNREIIYRVSLSIINSSDTVWGRRHLTELELDPSHDGTDFFYLIKRSVKNRIDRSQLDLLYSRDEVDLSSRKV